ncbi:MAG: type II toxin-antitoxin system RelE/ParE family toxin, partial [Chloroflexi bacterium]
MGSFKVRFKRSAEKDLRRLPKDVIKRVFTKIEELKQNALPVQAIKLRG